MADAFGSHLPVLESLCEGLKPSWVLEFGAGNHSTPYLLSQGVDLVSVEQQPEWQTIQGPHHWVVDRRLDPASFDLVLIDDIPLGETRLETIRYVLTREYPVTVVHDTDINREWFFQIEELAPYYTVWPGNGEPETTVIWPDAATRKGFAWAG